MPTGPPAACAHRERVQAFLSTDEDQHNELAAGDVDDELVEEPTSPEKISRLRVPQSLDCGDDGVDKSSSLMALIGNKRGIIGNKDGATIALISTRSTTRPRPRRQAQVPQDHGGATEMKIGRESLTYIERAK